MVLNYPYLAEHLLYTDRRISRLPRFSGQKDLLVGLPPGVAASSIAWISVWCRQFEVNFGQAILR